MKKEQLSLKDIAEMADVSTATVSHVINGTGRFSPETERRVRQIIDKYHYQPNQLARGLRVSKVKTVGILVPDITNEYFANITLDLQKRLMTRGYLTLICNTDEMPELEEKQLRMLLAQRVSGLIYISGRSEIRNPPDIPTVYIDRKPIGEAEDTPQVVIESDNRSGGYLAAKELIGCGCRKIACVSFRQEISAHSDRVQGYRDAVRECGLEELLFGTEEVSVEAGKAVMREVLASGQPVDGVFFTTDYLAAGALAHCMEHGIPLPSRMRIVGFDDISLCRTTWPQITTVRQSVESFGLLAVDTLMDLIDRKKAEKNYYRLPVELIRRQTT